MGCLGDRHYGTLLSIGNCERKSWTGKNVWKEWIFRRRNGGVGVQYPRGCRIGRDGRVGHLRAVSAAGDVYEYRFLCVERLKNGFSIASAYRLRLTWVGDLGGSSEMKLQGRR